MRRYPRTPLLDAFPSSPSSAWSCASSQSPSSEDYLSPLTPDSYFSPASAIVGPDEFTLQIDAQLDKMVGSPHESSITHLLPQSSAPSRPDPCFLSGDDTSKVQVFLRNRGRWDNLYHRFESSPPLRPHNAPRVPPLSQGSAIDDFAWEAPALADSNELPDPSRCSLLIQEVSLLVGLTAEDDHLSSDDGCPLVSDASKQVRDILPLSLTPTRSLASRKHRNGSLAYPASTNVPVHSSNIPIPPSTSPHADNAKRDEKLPPVGSRHLVTPIHHESADAGRPSLSPRRRQGQVLHFEPPFGNTHHRNAVVLDEMFFHPREPPPKPTPNPPANRCSSLDRLECSLRKLEAHAPGNHRKSQSEGWSPNHAPQRKDKHPSLPPPRRLKRQQSSHEITHRNPSRPAHGCHFSVPPPVPKPTPLVQHVVPRAVSMDDRDDHYEEDLTPGSFMDMDIPHTEEAWQKRRTSVRQVTGKEKMKSLVRVAKRVSRGVIAWGKNLTGSAKPPVTGQEMTTVQGASV